jgi:hypothetical protein
MELDHFIELDRRFRDITELDDSEEAAFRSYATSLLGMEPGLGWNEVLASRIVVILGEPGSGKTWELRNRANEMKGQGIPAFFVPLDRLVDAPLPEATAPEDERAFLEWRGSSKPANFFLDSVDEAKVRRQQDFGYALDHFVRGIGLSEVNRVRLVISARVSEWRGHADCDELLQRLGRTVQPSEAEETKGSDKIPELRIVQLEPLDRGRVRKFAESAGLQDPAAFIEALDVHHAWEFAGRPLDVAGLIGYWQEHGKLGTLTELIEFDLANKLRELAERIQNDPLTPQQARAGAECLGAAVLLCRRISFFIPDTIPPVDTGGVMVAAECLPSDWTPSMHRAMLARAVFDAASYGRIRFHHRRIAEHLAACWLEGRMREGCPYPVLEELLFAYRDGRWILRPGFRPVTAWLAAGDEMWNRRIRKRILSCAPDLFLTHGDPESLPLDYKHSLLEALITQHAGHERVYVDADAEAMSRVADPELSPYVAEKVRDRTISAGLRILLLRLIRHGRLRDCLDAALEIVASPHETEDLKSYAVAAIRDIGDQQARQRLAQITQDFETIDNILCARLCEALYPHAIGPADLAYLLRKAKGVQRYTVGLPWYLKQRLETELPGEQASELLQELLQLAEEAPRIRDSGQNTPISKRFYWLGEVIPTILIVLLKRPQLDDQEARSAARALWLLGYFRHYGKLDRDDLPAELNTFLDRHAAVRRAYVWLSIEERRRKKPDWEPHLFSVFGSYEVVEQREADIDWLIQDISESASKAMRVVALKLAIALWHNSGRKRSIRARIKCAVKGNRELHRLFQKEAANGIYARLKRLWYRHRLYDWKHKAWRLHHWLRQRHSNLRDQVWLWRNLGKLRSGTATHALSQLACESSKDHHHWGAHSWRPLIAKRGRYVACAAAAGWKAAWHRFEPPLPHEKPEPNQTDCRIIIGLSGINIALADGDLCLAAMTPGDARLACRYAVNEMNGFADWLPELARHQPDAVREVLAECIRGEWRISADREHVHKVLSSLRYDREGLASLVGEVILKELQASDPLHYQVLNAALTVLLNLSEPPCPVLADIATGRVPFRAIDDPRFTLWMIVWLQVDANPAMKNLQETLAKAADPDSLMVRLCAGLSTLHNRGYPLIQNPDYLRPACLRDFIPMVFRHVRVKDDIERSHGGGYSPTARDDARDFRNGLLERLAQVPGREADNALRALAENPLFGRYRDWILHLIKRHTEMDAEAPAWRPADIPTFMKEHEIAPRSDHDLFKIACKRFTAIKDEVERGEISARYDLHPEDPERQLRSWLARQLRQRSRKHYTVPQEEEVDLQQRPDIRIEAPGMGPVSIEVKWADHWTVRELEKGLVDQLVGQYLRAPNCNYGIYALGCKKTTSYWKDPEAESQLSFHDLVQHIHGIAKAVLTQRDDVNGLEVFGINFSRPSSSRQRKAEESGLQCTTR